jgi:hypothetical protein
MAVSTRRKPITNVDANLEAAAAPIALEPEAGEPRMDPIHVSRMQALIASGVSPDQARQWAHLPPEVDKEEVAEETAAPGGIEGRHAARMAELVRQGVPRQQAMEIAGREVIQAQSAEADARADARVQSGYRDPRQTAYNANTFAEGYGFDDSNQPAYLGPVNIDNMGAKELSDRAARKYNAYDPRGAEVALSDLPHPGRQVQADPSRPLGMTAPGPRTLDGRPPAPSRPLMTPEDVEAYDVRPPNGLSQRDRDMALRGMVPVVTPNGVSYMRAAGDTQTIGGPGRAGSRPDLLTKENPEQQWAVSERGQYMGPDGKPVSVLVPGPQMREKQATDLQGRQFAHKAKKAAMEERLQKSRDLFAATAILAGGSQNINAGNRGIYQQAAGIDDKAKQAEFLSQFRPGARGFQSNDPRIQIAQIDAQSRRETAEADREGRASEKQWLIAAEERADKRRAEEAKTEREFRAEERRLDAEAADKRGDNAALVEIGKLKLELENRKLEFEAKAKADELRHQETKAAMGGQTDAAKYTADARVREAEVTAAATGGELNAKREADATMLRTSRELDLQNTSPGLYDIMTGNASTEDAIRELKDIAAKADNFQYLPGGGFGAREAESMNDKLNRLQRQAELMGIQSPLSDPGYRRDLIKKWGYSSGWVGGRGGWMGDWFQPMPEELR